jgi:hypothetical protein
MMNPLVRDDRRRALLLMCVTISGSMTALGAATSEASLRRVKLAELCVTNGAVAALPDGKLAIDTASSRGVVQHSDGETAELRFRYLGPSGDSKPLASGEMRRQIGIKLHAQDSCNLLYVMWHIEPDAQIAVSVKRNPSQHTHAECHANGYINLHPIGEVTHRRILPGESHVLHAELHGTQLTVLADGERAWVGSVAGLDLIYGPVGFRTDNARFEFDYLAVIDAQGRRSSTVDETHNRCERQAGD